MARLVESSRSPGAIVRAGDLKHDQILAQCFITPWLDNIIQIIVGRHTGKSLSMYIRHTTLVLIIFVYWSRRKRASPCRALELE